MQTSLDQQGSGQPTPQPTLAKESDTNNTNNTSIALPEEGNHRNDEAPSPPPPVHPPIPDNQTTRLDNEEQNDAEEEDPLIVAQREQEEREKALEEALNIQPYDDAEMREFYADMREVDRENQVNRILGAFKLNPFEMLGLPFDASNDEIKRAYRKVSLAVHPDKCTHPQAKDAFEIIGHAQKELLNEDTRKQLDFLLNHAKEEVIRDWKRASKNDAATKVASLLNESGKSGVVASWQQTPEFHDAWKTKARDVLARAEWRRRKLTKRIKEEEERAKEEHQTEKDENKRKREAEKAWDSTREQRVGSWRDFVNNAGTSGKKKKSKSAATGVIGGLKPPKTKQHDGNKTYVQRPVEKR